MKNDQILKIESLLNEALRLIGEAQKELIQLRSEETTETPKKSYVKPISIKRMLKWDELTNEARVAYGIEILKACNIDYQGKALAISLHYVQRDFGLEIPYQDFRKVLITVLADDNKQLASKEVSTEMLRNKFYYLTELGLFHRNKNHIPNKVYVLVD